MANERSSVLREQKQEEEEEAEIDTISHPRLEKSLNSEDLYTLLF